MNHSREPDLSSYLERLLVGDLDPHSEEARRLFEEHASLRAEYEVLLQAQGKLAGAASREKEDLSTIQTPAEDRELVRQSWRSIWQQEGADRSAGNGRSGPTRAFPRDLPRGLLLLAAAALVLLLIFWRQPWRPAKPPGFLGPESSVQGVSPLGEVDSLQTYLWQAAEPLEPDQSFTLIVRSAAGGLLRVANLTATEYTLTDADLEQLGPVEEVLWSVELRDAYLSRPLQTSPTLEARLR